jgi:hypothetical protein
VAPLAGSGIGLDRGDAMVRRVGPARLEAVLKSA